MDLKTETEEKLFVCFSPKKSKSKWVGTTWDEKMEIEH